MTNRIIEVSERAAALRVANHLLEVAMADGSKVTVQPEEIAVLLLANPRLRLSQSVLSTVTEAGGFVVVVNKRYLPAGLLLPLEPHSTHAEILRAQVAAKRPLKKRLWQQVVRQKIRAQAGVLEQLYKEDFGLRELSDQVRSGDPDNLEARAARIYWSHLFGENKFSRNREADDANILLNYGYTVLRAAVARAVCSAGLLPSLGLHHHNRYDAFCLADDLMEPFRPLIDAAVVELAPEFDAEAGLSPRFKQRLIAPVMGDVQTERGNEKLFALLSRMAASLVRCFRGEADQMTLPIIE